MAISVVSKGIEEIRDIFELPEADALAVYAYGHALVSYANRGQRQGRLSLLMARTALGETQLLQITDFYAEDANHEAASILGFEYRPEEGHFRTFSRTTASDVGFSHFQLRMHQLIGHDRGQIDPITVAAMQTLEDPRAVHGDHSSWEQGVLEILEDANIIARPRVPVVQAQM